MSHTKEEKKKKVDKDEGDSHAEEAKKSITRKDKSDAMEDKKDNYEKKPSEKLKKKRGTSDGYLHKH